MKINIITGAFGYIPPKGIGAIEKLWFDLACEFAKSGNEVIIYAKQFDKKIKEENICGVKVKYVKGYERTGTLKGDLWWDFLYSLRVLKEMDKTDVLLLNSFMTPLLCPYFKKKYKVSVYNIARLPKGQYKYFKKVDRLASCSTMITKAVLQQTPEVHSIIKTLNNPINTDVFRFKEKEAHDKINIVYTGRIHPEKGLVNLAKATAMLHAKYPTLQLTLVGTSDTDKGGGGMEYVKAINEAAGAMKIRYTGAISNPQELAAEIHAADIYCYPPLPTTGDAMPCAPLEAMATGTATLLSDLPCFDDYAVDGQNVLRFDVKENGVDNLKNAIERLICEPEFRTKIGKAGAETAEKFSNAHIASVFIDDFNLLLQQKNGKTIF